MQLTLLLIFYVQHILQHVIQNVFTPLFNLWFRHTKMRCRGAYTVLRKCVRALGVRRQICLNYLIYLLQHTQRPHSALHYRAVQTTSHSVFFKHVQNDCRRIGDVTQQTNVVKWQLYSAHLGYLPVLDATLVWQAADVHFHSFCGICFLAINCHILMCTVYWPPWYDLIIVCVLCIDRRDMT